MTIEKITITLGLFGENYENLEIEMTLDQLQECMRYTTDAFGEYKENGHYPKGLWLYINGYYQTMKKLNMLKKRQ